MLREGGSEGGSDMSREGAKREPFSDASKNIEATSAGCRCGCEVIQPSSERRLSNHVSSFSLVTETRLAMAWICSGVGFGHSLKAAASSLSCVSVAPLCSRICLSTPATEMVGVPSSSLSHTCHAPLHDGMQSPRWPCVRQQYPIRVSPPWCCRRALPSIEYWGCPTLLW